MIRFADGRRVVRCVADIVECNGDTEKLARNGDPPAGDTVPVIVAPLLATNDAEPPLICALVAVATCVPTVEASVHITVTLPSLSLVAVGGDTLPPPVTAHVTGTPA